MVRIEEVHKILGKPKNVNRLVVKNQTTANIIDLLRKQHTANVVDAKKIAHLFDGGNLRETCKNIWNFLKYEVPYKVEPADKQTIKTLPRMIDDAINGGGNDCKHYSGFTGAILSALGYKNWVYRFAGYSDYINVPTHVYVVCKTNNGNIYCDAVISGFDLEKPYKLKIDKKMALYQLSGIDEIGGLFSSIKKTVKKAGGAIKQTAKQTVNIAKKVKQGVLTTSLAIPRNAFLLLVRFNVHGWATGLNKMDWNQLSWWKDWFGGNRTDLQNAIKAGAKNKRILGVSDGDVIYPDQVGFIGEPTTVAAALASAAPIIAKVSDVLSKAEKISNTVEKVSTTADKTKQAVVKANAGFKSITGKSIDEVIFKKDAGKAGNKNSIDQTDFSTPTDAEANKVAEALVNPKQGKSNLPLILGAGALAAILLTRKR